MTRKPLLTLFVLLLGLVFTNQVIAQTNTFELSPNTATATSPQSINAMWDLELSFNLNTATGAAGNAGAEFDGTYFYSTRWGSNLIHKYDMSGNLVEEFSIPGVSGLRDLAFDGTYFYGGAASTTIYKMDFVTKTLVGTISSPVAVRYIAYDEDNDAFWCGNWSDNPTLVSRTGATLASFATGLSSQYGAAYDNVTAGGPYLWIFDQGGGACPGSLMMIQYDIATGTATGVSHDACDDLTDGIAGGLFSTTDFVSGKFSIGGVMQSNSGLDDTFFVFEVGDAGSTNVVSIAQAIEDLDNDFVPDHLGDTLTVQGVVFSPNYQTSNTSFYISDGTAGTDIFLPGSILTWNLGDMVEVTGYVNQYNGMTEIQLLDASSWSLISTGNTPPNPVVLTLAQYKANPEMYEGSLVGFISLDLAGGTWPAAGSSANLQLTDGQDTVTFRIDSDTDIDGQPEPTWPVDVVGIGSQYDTTPPYDGGYQIFPRYYAQDFLPAGSLPVELTSFTAEANLNSVSLNWNTASETNNRGFEIQRNAGSGFATIGFVQGMGTSSQSHAYSFVDQNLAAGHYTYRLKQLDFNGAYSYSTEVSVEINPVTYSLAQNYPNPFNPTTMINFNLRVDSKVSLKVFNILGQEVSQLVNGSMVAGNHQINFNASKLNSGVYLYRLEATGVDGSTFSSVRKMMLTK